MSEKKKIFHATDRPTPLRGLGTLIGSYDPNMRRDIRHGDRVEVLLLDQENAADNGPWIAQDGDWERPAPVCGESEER